MPNQAAFDFPVELPKSAYSYGERSSGETHGVVLTKPHIVQLILDLADYSEDSELHRLRLLEPSCGHGVFLREAVRRLIHTAKRDGISWRDLVGAVVAFDIDPEAVRVSRSNVAAVLQRSGVPAQVRKHLVNEWVREGDFLLAADLGRFDVVVGNPPYIRIEQLSAELQFEYRRRFESLYDRADLYVAFIQRGLELLAQDGTLSFICADRWTRNRYGSQLRRIVTERYRVRAYVDLNQASPFESDVVAYPSIFAISPGPSGKVFVSHLPTGSPDECTAVVSAMNDSGVAPEIQSAIYDSWFTGEEPWVLGSPEHLAFLRNLETNFATLEADGRTKVGIGIASGNDKVYIVPEGADIEDDRLLPLVMRSDLDKGKIQNAHRRVINTFEDNGGLVDLRRYPRLAAYFEEHAEVIRRRHVAQRSGDGWFRTIDRAYPSLVPKPKLLIPDIAGSNEVTFDAGQYHPHHNLYFITSDSWDLEVLGGLLSSRAALYFIWSYATRMRGGYLRFQAQYLRRIRVPDPASLSPALARDLRRAFRSRDFKKLDELALRAYGLKSIPPFEFIDTRT